MDRLHTSLENEAKLNGLNSKSQRLKNSSSFNVSFNILTIFLIPIWSGQITYHQDIENLKIIFFRDIAA